MSSPRVGFAEAVCPKCGKTLRRKRPADLAVCDCYECCPLCGKKMQSFTPDLTPSTYGVEESLALKGQAVEPQGWDINTVCVCYNHTPPYYSRQEPVEVRLT